ncbi:MAG: hypothetical protein JWN40_5759 [Phycisphaerales bacterium]|nr:hypothetical protein [Phycisphaerales bacterium]
MPLMHFVNRVIVRGLALSSFIVAMSGCAAPSALLYKFAGPPAIPPKYVIPQRPLLLLVENAHSGAVALPEADELTRVIYDDLLEHKVAPLIDPSRVHDLRDAAPLAFGKMSIAQIGQRLGAAQVLYLHVDQLDIEVPQGSEMVRVKIAVKAKMIDVPTAQTVWPMSGDTEPYDFETRLQRTDASLTRSALNHQMLRGSGVEIARWFYAYQPETMREENQDLKLR